MRSSFRGRPSMGRFSRFQLASASNYSRRTLDRMARDGKDAGLDELQFRAWRAFLYVYSLVVPTLDRELVRAQGLTFNQFEVLVWVRRAGEHGLRMSDLASRVVLSPSGVTRAVDQLERMGLVERCVFEGDKRGQVAKVTVEGKAFLRKATKAHLEGLRRHFLDHLSRSDLQHLATAMEAVLDGEGSPLPSLS
jgi:DNA-binding MarR family transcriptional regulator